MLVYNLTQGEVTYKGKKIPSNGGSVNIQDLSFIPNRDLELETAKILSFGKLPQWWLVEQALKSTVVEAPVAKAPVAQPVEAPKIVITTDSVEVTDKPSMSTFSKKK